MADVSAKRRPPILDKIPTMKLDAIMRLWRNAVIIRANGKNAHNWRDAAQVIDAINQEWDRRRRQPLKAEGFFYWPSTEAEPGKKTKINVDGWIEEGILRYMGYQVGATNSISSNLRHRILEQIFEGALPPVFPPVYLDEWGTPKSAIRLQKMAETIAAFTRNAKRKRNDALWGAIRDWENDLRFLYDQFYMGHFYFSWPNSDLAKSG